MSQTKGFNKKQGRQRIWLWVLNCGVGEDSRVPWTARRSNQSILKEISPGCSLEGMMLKLKLQYFGHFMQRVDLLEKTLMLGGIGGRRKRGWQRMRWLDGITDLTDVSLSEPREMVVDREAWRAAIHGVAKSQTRLSDWIEWVNDFFNFPQRCQKHFVTSKAQVSTERKSWCWWLNGYYWFNRTHIFKKVKHWGH